MSLRDIVKPIDSESQIVAFYSYKGGVGRTMALCNVASRIAWLHARTMATDKSECRILVVDLDLEAPGVPSFLSPPPKMKVKGFLGLILKYLKNEDQWTPGKATRDRLRKALGENLLNYAYKVPKTENLFVLPIGHVSISEAAWVRRELHERLADLRETDSESRENQYVPLFTELKVVLKELFEYAFIDARTGLSDTAYATTIALADSMVFLFRPNITQLIGIQDVFGRFLRQRGLSLDDSKNIPAIPVLSPRPTHSTPHLKKVREVASKRIFRWLDTDKEMSRSSGIDPYAPELTKLIELPFDSSMEVGERLMILPSPDEEPEDTHAPLYLEYLKLAEEIQKRNANRDTLGMRFLEQQLWRNDNKVESLNCLLSIIARKPDDIDMWKEIWNGYSSQLSDSTPIQNMVLKFCEKARKFPLEHHVPRFFGTLWQSEIYEKIAPGLCGTLISELWQIADASTKAEMFEYALVRLNKWYINHSGKDSMPNCPSFQETVAARFLAMITGELDRPKLFKTLSNFEVFYNSEQSDPEHTIQLYTDELVLSTKEHNRAMALTGLGETYRMLADFRTSFSAYAAAAQLEACPSSSEKSFISLHMRLLPSDIAETAIKTVLTPEIQPVWLMLLEIRKFSDIDTVRKRIDQLKESAKHIAEDPSFEYYAMMHHQRFKDAAKIMGERLSKVKGGADIDDLAKVRLAQWLDNSAAFDDDMSKYAKAAIANPNLVLDEPNQDVCLALAACLNDVALEAKQRVQQPQYPIVRFGWSLVACLCDMDVDSLLPEIQLTIEDNPLLAPWFRKQEDWPLFRFVLKHHRELQNIDDSSFQRRVKVLDLIESVEVVFDSQPDPIPIPEPISSTDDPRFNEIVERWKGNLRWIRDDDVMATVVDALVEYERQDDEEK